MEISKMLTISTCHVTPDTLELMGEDANGANNFPFLGIYEKMDFGYFIYIQKEVFEEAAGNGMVGDDLKAVVALAIENGCGLLCLDCDGEELDCLTDYSHE